MKKLIVPALIALVAGFSPQAGAADAHAGHGQPAEMSAPAARAPLSEGLVKKVDKAAGKVTLSHGPLANGMPAMTMAFRVKDAAWVGKMQAGQKIRFAANEIDGVMTLVRFETLQ